MKNQPVVQECSQAVKGTACICVVGAVSLPWVAAASGLGFIPGIVLGAAGILLGMASVACAVVALCRKSVAFGIIMILIGVLACAVAGTECMYLMF